MVVKSHQLNTIPGIYPAIPRFQFLHQRNTNMIINRWIWNHLEDTQRKAEHCKHKFVKGHQVRSQFLHDPLIINVTHDQGQDLGLTSLGGEKEQLADKLEKRFQNKEEFLRKMNRKKEMKAVRGERVTVVEQRAEEKRQKRMRNMSPEEPLM